MLSQLLDDFCLIAIVLLVTVLCDRLGLPAPLGLLVAVPYLLFSDALPRGQSLGKLPLNLAVVDASTGLPCTYWKSFVRNIFLLLGIFDWIFIFGEKRQRLGDMAANTVVVNVAR